MPSAKSLNGDMCKSLAQTHWERWRVGCVALFLKAAGETAVIRSDLMNMPSTSTSEVCEDTVVFPEVSLTERERETMCTQYTLFPDKEMLIFNHTLLLKSRGAVSIFKKAHNTCLTCSSLVKCARVLEWNVEDVMIVFFDLWCWSQQVNLMLIEYFVRIDSDVWRDFWSNRLLGKCDRVYFWPCTHTHERAGTFITAGLLSGLLRSRWKWGAQLCASRGLQQHTMTVCECVCVCVCSRSPLMWCSHVLDSDWSVTSFCSEIFFV